eukprot:sb/3474457/
MKLPHHASAPVGNIIGVTSQPTLYKLQTTTMTICAVVSQWVIIWRYSSRPPTGEQQQLQQEMQQQELQQQEHQQEQEPVRNNNDFEIDPAFAEHRIVQRKPSGEHLTMNLTTGFCHANQQEREDHKKQDTHTSQLGR